MRFRNCLETGRELKALVSDAVSPHGERAKLFAPTIEEWLTADHETACSQLDQACKDCIEVAVGAGTQDMEL